jgi:uncharacterized protein (TIGR02466 family)
MSEQRVFALFSTPLYVNNVGAFPRPDLRSLEYASAAETGGVYNFKTSVDKNVLHRAEFKAVHDLVMKEVDVYAHGLCGVAHNVHFYVTNSWINVHARGQAAGAHIHGNSLISGVLYLDVNETSGDLVFHRDIYSLIPFPPALDFDVDQFNIYNCKSWSYKPKVNDICLFPSTVMHSADANASDQERWCLAFNVFARGTFGGLHQLSIK